MKNLKIYFFSALIPLLIQGCDFLKSTFDKQVSSCIEDVKLGLGDPNSLEVISTEGVEASNGTFHIRLNFTAKNALGGRVRGNTTCGFANKVETKLNPDDPTNQMRKIQRDLKSLGIN